ncbi:uncharacterized protein LOC144666909 isoform X2 [Oculina patagonica]
MEVQAERDSTTERRVSCSCKSTCSTRRASGTNRGCPCKGAGVHCGAECTCGTTTKPCRNKADGGSSTSAGRPAQARPYNPANNRPSEEEERVQENQNVKEFIQTLDEPMVRKLCIRSLRRGVGSMDFIQGLLIAEDDLDEDENEATPDMASADEPVQTPVSGASPEPGPSSVNHLPWCKCGVCQIMPQEVENKCCGQRRCVTTHTRFQKLCLDPDVLQLAVRNRGDVRNDREDNSTRSFRKASYRQYVLDRYGYLGKGNRKVCPSCVVKTVRQHYPSQTGVYMGFRPE